MAHPSGPGGPMAVKPGVYGAKVTLTMGMWHHPGYVAQVYDQLATTVVQMALNAGHTPHGDVVLLDPVFYTTIGSDGDTGDVNGEGAEPPVSMSWPVTEDSPDAHFVDLFAEVAIEVPDG